MRFAVSIPVRCHANWFHTNPWRSLPYRRIGNVQIYTDIMLYVHMYLYTRYIVLWKNTCTGVGTYKWIHNVNIPSSYEGSVYISKYQPVNMQKKKYCKVHLESYAAAVPPEIPPHCLCRYRFGLEICPEWGKCFPPPSLFTDHFSIYNTSPVFLVYRIALYGVVCLSTFLLV